MTTFGCFLSSEENGPRALVEQAQMAERAGFERVTVSDHFHPWMDSQGESPFVWSVIGGIAATTNLEVTTAVTCPILRIHPAIVAQAAATSSSMLQGSFRLGQEHAKPGPSRSTRVSYGVLPEPRHRPHSSDP